VLGARQLARRGRSCRLSCSPKSNEKGEIQLAVQQGTCQVLMEIDFDIIPLDRNPFHIFPESHKASIVRAGILARLTRSGFLHPSFLPSFGSPRKCWCASLRFQAGYQSAYTASLPVTNLAGLLSQGV